MFEGKRLKFGLTTALISAALTVSVEGRTQQTSVTMVGSSPEAHATAVSAQNLVIRYEPLAGSTHNAASLIAGLRDGKPVLLLATADGANPTAASLTFTPATRPMGYGNVNIALALAQAQLTALGITAPTPGQLAAALNGGVVVTANGSFTLKGVLTQRAADMGWGAIAQSMGFKLGAVVRAADRNKPLAAHRVEQRDEAKDMVSDMATRVRPEPTAEGSSNSDGRGRSGNSGDGNNSSASGGRGNSNGSSGGGHGK